MRASIELPAITIFSVVAGALILLFFVVLAQSQGERARDDTQAQSLQNIDSLLKSSSTAKSTNTNVTVIDDIISFKCDETGTWFGYEETDIKLPINNIILFSPSKLTGGQLRAATLSSDVPYRALNILYLSTDSQVVYSDSPIPGFPFEISQNFGYDNFKQVYLDNRNFGQFMSRNLKKDQLAVYKEGTNEYGQLKYFPDNHFNDANKLFVYPNRELLYGAILSENADQYVCLFNAYLHQLQFVNKVQWERARNLKQHYYDNSMTCFTRYQNTGENGAFAIIDRVTKISAENWEISDAKDFNDAIKSIEYENANLLRGDNCAPIY